MLFVTNRTPTQSPRSRRNRNISFDLNNTAISQFLYFCERKDKFRYVEVMDKAFFEKLRDLPNPKAEIVLYIHGFNNTPEANIFPKTERLQALLDAHGGRNEFHVVPLIWPCDDDSFVAIADDYWDDQKAADQSGTSFARMLGFFDKWRTEEARTAEREGRDPCMRRINVLAHSMGNRVLRNALRQWVEELGGRAMPLMFRNIFMAAADVVNETLEDEQEGRYIPQAARNTVVYYAADDLAMPASKVANLRSRTASRRLGMTGPEKLDRVPPNVYAVDCDNFNTQCDPPTGHGYFLDFPNGKPSPVLHHMVKALKTGRVSPNERRHILDVD
ncbi:MAG: alpha/beta hydrolase [Thiohalocapsa sp.]